MANKVVVHSQPDLTKASKRSRDPIKIIKEEMVIPDRLFQYCNGKKCFIRTYGCQANVVDSQNILGILEELGYIPVEDPFESDIIILNTCAVRENAEEKVFGEVGALKKYKTQHPDAVIAVCGCMNSTTSCS